MTRLIAALAVAMVVTQVAVASTGPPSPWTRANTVAAVKALGYPKPNARKLACTGIGTADTSGRYFSFRCKATYARHRVRRFQIEGRGEGGWLCAGQTIAGCKLLKRGFVSKAAVATEGFDAAGQLAADGWVSNHYGVYQVTHACTPDTTLNSSYTCGFHVSSGDITVALDMKVVKPGYVLTASTS
jgi:hypothetical protein